MASMLENVLHELGRPRRVSHLTVGRTVSLNWNRSIKMRKGIPIEAIQVESLFDCDQMPIEEGKYLLAQADAILAYDVMSEVEVLVFGNDAVLDAALSDGKQDLRVLQVAIDEDSDELDRLLALVLVVKGYHDYEW
jgi:hypothetical protein